MRYRVKINKFKKKWHNINLLSTQTNLRHEQWRSDDFILEQLILLNIW
jgi:hypothetical protein